MRDLNVNIRPSEVQVGDTISLLHHREEIYSSTAIDIEHMVYICEHCPELLSRRMAVTSAIEWQSRLNYHNSTRNKKINI